MRTTRMVMLLGLSWAVLGAGCGKKGAESPAPEPQVDPAPAPVPAEPAPAEPSPVPAPAPEPGGEGGAMCGGIAAIQCPGGFTCIDDPADTCDPAQGGRDCSGKCVACDAPELNRKVVSDDPSQCAAMRFTCAAGEEAWFDDCGCGCVKKP
jgi:hypothetical protein